MEVIVARSTGELGAVAADAIDEAVQREPRAVLGFATGSSPLAVYAELEARAERGALDLSRARGFALDEYVGLPEDHPESYAAVIAREVVRPLGMDPALVRVPDGRSVDLYAACQEYEEAIAAAGGIDVQLLGIGSNGHLAFNEPGSSLSSRTRVCALTEQTRTDNARFFASPDEVPRYAVTQGVGTILEARRLVLVASGAGKAEAVRRAVEEPVSSSCPASALQRHPDVTLVLDEAAASRLSLASYSGHAGDESPVIPTIR